LKVDQWAARLVESTVVRKEMMMVGWLVGQSADQMDRR